MIEFNEVRAAVGLQKLVSHQNDAVISYCQLELIPNDDYVALITPSRESLARLYSLQYGHKDVVLSCFGLATT